jgi:hypothetical protein
VRRLVTNLIFVLLLSGCASVEINQSAANFDENKYAVDLNTCRGGHLLAATFETVKYSTAGGAVGAIHGLGAAVHADSIEAMIIGAAAGGFLGAGVGIYNGFTERQSEISSCLMEKGFTINH